MFWQDVPIVAWHRWLYGFGGGQLESTSSWNLSQSWGHAAATCSKRLLFLVGQLENIWKEGWSEDCLEEDCVIPHPFCKPVLVWARIKHFSHPEFCVQLSTNDKCNFFPRWDGRLVHGSEPAPGLEGRIAKQPVTVWLSEFNSYDMLQHATTFVRLCPRLFPPVGCEVESAPELLRMAIPVIPWDSQMRQSEKLLENQ